jgi:hypothetical protein
MLLSFITSHVIYVIVAMAISVHLIVRIQRRKSGSFRARRRADFRNSPNVDPTTEDPRAPGLGIISDHPWDFGPKQH